MGSIRLHCSRAWRFATQPVALALAMVLGVASGAFATDPPPLLPDTGISVGDYITEAIVAMAVVVGLVVGGYFAFLIVKKGMTWGRRAL